MKNTFTKSLLLFWLLIASVIVTADESDWECRALACLQNPYGPGAAPGCAAPLARLQSDLVKGLGLPSCGSTQSSERDYVSRWYWKAVGWTQCDNSEAQENDCGEMHHESRTEFLPFVIGSYEVLEAQSIERLNAFIRAYQEWPAEHQIAINVVGHWMSRQNNATEALAARRAATVAEYLQSALGQINLITSTTILNQALSQKLLHGVEISVIGRTVYPARTFSGVEEQDQSPCGLVEIGIGSLRRSVAALLAACGYQIGDWRLGMPDHSVDYLEDRARIRNTGSSVETVLAYLRREYGIDSSIDDTDVSFFRLSD